MRLDGRTIDELEAKGLPIFARAECEHLFYPCPTRCLERCAEDTSDDGKEDQA